MTEVPELRTVVTDEREPVVLIGLDRPERRNALDLATIEALHEVLDTWASEPSILVVHSTTPGMFVAGADIAELRDRGAEDALRSLNAGLFERLETHRWPTIAAIDGPALGGGCELAMACDLRIATVRASFAQPELALGILAGAGANWRLPQLIGVAAARRMLYMGEMLDAEAAERAGLVDVLVDEGHDVVDTAVSVAGRIAERSWRALELTKLALRLHRPATTSFDIVAQSLLFETEDKRERMTAFLERRERRER